VNPSGLDAEAPPPDPVEDGGGDVVADPEVDGVVEELDVEGPLDDAGPLALPEVAPAELLEWCRPPEPDVETVSPAPVDVGALSPEEGPSTFTSRAPAPASTRSPRATRTSRPMRLCLSADGSPTPAGASTHCPDARGRTTGCS
jgi:hypothetical protein